MTLQLRPGRANGALIGSIALVAVLVGWILFTDRKPARVDTKPLLMYCAVAVKSPVEQIARDFEAATGLRVELQFGASQTLITNATVSHTGDLYLPADDSYINACREKGLLGREFALAIQRPVLAVKKGNPKQIHQIGDLSKHDIRLAQANPDAAASGKVTREIFRKTGDWDAIQQHTTVFTSTVVEAANDLKLGTVDAAFIWDAMATQYAELEVVPLEALKDAESKLVIAVLKSSERPDVAEKFANYLASPKHGHPFFRKAGFTVLPR